MTKFQRAPELSEWRKSPVDVLFRRGVVATGVSVMNRVVGGVTGKISVCSGRTISSGFRPKLGVGSVPGCISSVRVLSPLRPGASAYGLNGQGPKSMLVGMLQKAKRAAAAQKRTRLQQRFSRSVAYRVSCVSVAFAGQRSSDGVLPALIDVASGGVGLRSFASFECGVARRHPERVA